MTIQGLVKIEDNPMPKATNKNPGKSRKTNEDLPKGCRDGNFWRGRFIPTWLWVLGFSSDPWIIDDGEAAAILQKIWDVVYHKTISYTIVVNDAVFTIVSTSRLLGLCLHSYLG